MTDPQNIIMISRIVRSLCATVPKEQLLDWRWQPRYYNKWFSSLLCTFNNHSWILYDGRPLMCVNCCKRGHLWAINQLIHDLGHLTVLTIIGDSVKLSSGRGRAPYGK